MQIKVVFPLGVNPSRKKEHPPKRPGLVFWERTDLQGGFELTPLDCRRKFEKLCARFLCFFTFRLSKQGSCIRHELETFFGHFCHKGRAITDVQMII